MEEGRAREASPPGGPGNEIGEYIIRNSGCRAPYNGRGPIRSEEAGMRRGLRWFLVLAVFAALFLLVAILATFTVGTGPRVPGSAVLWVRLGSEMSEEDRRSSLEKALGRPALTVRDYVRVFDEASRDRRVRAVVLDLRGFGGGWAMA
jgi:hypothetical protein